MLRYARLKPLLPLGLGFCWVYPIANSCHEKRWRFFIEKGFKTPIVWVEFTAKNHFLVQCFLDILGSNRLEQKIGFLTAASKIFDILFVSSNIQKLNWSQYVRNLSFEQSGVIFLSVKLLVQVYKRGVRII